MAKEEKGEYRAIDSRYRRDVAIVNARPKLETGALVIWAAVDILLLLVFVFGVIMYIVSGSFADARTSASILENASSTAASVTRLAPAGLTISDTKSASVVTGHYDLYASVENSNDDWYATFDYVFMYDGGATETASGFVNPKATRLVTAINVAAAARPTGVRLTLQNLVWHHIDKHVIPDPAQYVAERANITVDEATYSKDLTVGTDQLGRSSITLTNRTAYAYWQPEFLVKLMRGSTIISLTKVSVPQFLSHETRVLDVRWFGEVPPSGTISIEPIISYFDPGVYMEPGDETSPDVRR